MRRVPAFNSIVEIRPCTGETWSARPAFQFYCRDTALLPTELVEKHQEPFNSIVEIHEVNGVKMYVYKDPTFNSIVEILAAVPV